VTVLITGGRSSSEELEMDVSGGLFTSMKSKDLLIRRAEAELYVHKSYSAAEL
jgi:hypothetical protein